MTEFISIRGVRENNLKDVTLEIPKGKLTIFTGVSGSGKSSIVFAYSCCLPGAFVPCSEWWVRNGDHRAG